jgi:FAD/FMN-containing dehydrogenase
MKMGKISGVATFALCLIAAQAGARETVNDVSHLNPIVVEKVEAPTSAAEVSRLVRGHQGPVCIGGARHSQGGQIATDNCLFLDMRKMNRVLKLDLRARRISVQAGISWRKIQEAIDTHGLSLSIMQTYSNFTVGGSLSVNAHGRYVGRGPLVGSVLSIVVVLADGSIVEASRTQNREVFDAAIGGYGGIGVIVSATLQLAPNTHIERVAVSMPVSRYREYFFRNVRGAPGAVFHNADIYPPDYEDLTAVTWVATNKPLTVTDRLAPLGMPSATDRLLMGWLSSGPFGKQIRQFLYDPSVYSKPAVEWRNYEASYDAASLEPASRERYTYVLQEYFVPPAQFERFTAAMAKILRASHANVLNISVRHAEADKETMLAWAPQEMFAFVIYFRQGTRPAERDAVRKWTASLIGEALAEGGTYYLPYQIVATRGQFLRAYPAAPRFFALKARLDPSCKFRNKLWDAYDDAPACRR